MSLSSKAAAFACCAALLLLLLAARGQPTPAPELQAGRRCPNMTGNGHVLSLQPPTSGTVRERCRCDQADNARRVCPVRRCVIADPSLLSPEYSTDHCVSDQPRDLRISLMDFYCRETAEQLEVLEFVGKCAEFSVYRRANRTVSTCGLEVFRSESYFLHKGNLQKLARDCN